MSCGFIMTNEQYMKEALKQAKKAYEKGEIPIGAVVVYQGKIIARAYNKREMLQDVTAHAEVLAIKKACKKLQSWRLEDCSIYVTLEPCVMCAGAMIQARVKKVYYGARNTRFGVHQGPVHLFDVPFNHKVEVESGILEADCSSLISQFFGKMRSTK